MLLSGNVDLISGGVAPAVILWDKTNGAAKLLAALSEPPVVLNTSNPKVRTIADFTANDKDCASICKGFHSGDYASDCGGKTFWTERLCEDRSADSRAASS
ncbi:MAG: hypothetical protein LBK13_12855 [Spirochaetales bacterium]|nr:hypothetical protein [Spirochaetales bacterium]